VFFIDSQTATIVNVGPPNQSNIAQWCGTPANQSKYQIKPDIHIYPNILPSIIFLLYLQCDIKIKIVAFFSGTPCMSKNFLLMFKSGDEWVKYCNLHFLRSSQMLKCTQVAAAGSWIKPKTNKSIYKFKRKQHNCCGLFRNLRRLVSRVLIWCWGL
jgi:hypothetical protein